MIYPKEMIGKSDVKTKIRFDRKVRAEKKESVAKCVSNLHSLSNLASSGGARAHGVPASTAQRNP